MSKTPAELHRQSIHIWHVWMNKFAEKERAEGSPSPHSLYEFKDLLQFLDYGWKRLQDAFTGKLPQTHRQCSHSPVEQVPENKLMCCLGVECTSCEILVSIKGAFDEERQRECGTLGKYYSEVPDEEMYRRMADTCAWHIYKTVTKGQEGWGGVDTSEGHLLDKTDRMFWDRTHASMAASDPGDVEVSE